MNIRYSEETGTFYPFDITYPTLPSDLVEVPITEYHKAMTRPPGTAFRFVGNKVEIFTPEPGPAPIPKKVTMRQARLALRAAGKLADVDAAINQLPEPDQTNARIEWEYSQEVSRDQTFVQTLAPTLGLDDESLDALFLHAATL